MAEVYIYDGSYQLKFPELQESREGPQDGRIPRGPALSGRITIMAM
ncbi:MAG: hypothetical protein MZU91_13315 [Desulfosudis oleivorans]|nr:hypothetical protein [Desulfosudis oleivorans]